MRLLVPMVAALAATACTDTLYERPGADAAPAPAPVERSAPKAPARADRFTVVATGDVLIHPALTEQAEADASANGTGARDFGPLFAGVKPLISGADLGICHLEVPLAGKDGPFSGWPSFNAPPEVADALKATGYDVCSTASNHTLDRGPEGVVRTLDTLDAAKLRHTGSYRDERSSNVPLVMDVAGVKVGLVSFTFGFNGIPLPEGKPWMANQLDVPEVLADARAARQAGAEVVIASLHWGVEHQHDPTEEQLAQAKEVLGAAEIDLILGHHAHVVQPFERIGDEWVAYGLGNHVARHEEPTGMTEEGVAARFTFQRGPNGWKVSQAEFIPTLVDLGPPIRLLDLTSGDAGTRHPEALARTERVVLGRGAAQDGLRRPGG